MLQAGRSRFRVPTRSFSLLNVSSRTMVLGFTQLRINGYQTIFLEIERGQRVKPTT
jgi:hypothetical protein